ncbi:MAG: transposase [bacterium]
MHIFYQSYFLLQKGRRKYLACNDLRVTARQILIGYRMRWAIEIFHKTVKMHLGFEDVATKCFKSVNAHVHWVYCAYILLHINPPNVYNYGKTAVEKKQTIRRIVDSREISRTRLKLTQSGGLQKYKDELRVALESIGCLETPAGSGVKCI